MPLITTPKRICEYVGESPNRFYHLVKSENLPAWQSGNKRVWKATREDLNKWIYKQRDTYLKNGI